jgi:hypothetical protein
MLSVTDHALRDMEAWGTVQVFVPDPLVTFTTPCQFCHGSGKRHVPIPAAVTV